MVWQVSLMVWLAPDLVSSFDSSVAVKQTLRLVLLSSAAELGESHLDTVYL